MTQEDKQLLLKDLSARLLYGVKYQVIYTNDTSIRTIEKVVLDGEYSLFDSWLIEEIKPYLRPMSSMTEKEQHEYDNLCLDNLALPKVHLYYPMRWHTMDYLHVDWLNAHHFDYRGLIEKGLALEAPADMYKTE